MERVPPRCQVITREEGVELLRPGDITFCVLARSETNEFGRQVYASLGLAIPADPIGAARVRHDRGGERRTG
jgi:arginine decarboxylase